MSSCPACGGARFDRGRCVKCGSPQAPEPVDFRSLGLTLTEVGTPEASAGGVALPGFEPTWMEERRAPRAVEPPPEVPRAEVIVGAICPRCGDALPDPPGLFCDGCGNRLPRTRKPVVQATGARRCPSCGSVASPDRSRCVACGGRLGSGEV